jgi:adenylate cyclase
MAEERVKRKLTAILSADAKGYSRLMGEDEAATVQTLKVYREAMTSLIKEHGGRVVDSPGDNLLAEFGSVVDAVDCAAKIQEELKAKNVELPESRRMEFRIGVHLGDVIDDETRIYGDGVNVAARIEGLAEAGGVCISRMAFDNVKNKLNLGYEYLGEHSVKNIAEPVRVYRVLMEAEAAGKVIGEERPRRWRWLAAAVALIVVVVGLAIWNFYLRPPQIEPASVERMAFPLPDKPSIAVLPFVNMSEDKGQEYFSDGLTEEIISALSKAPKLFVIARNSTFTYKGKPVKVQQVSEDLGVRYVLEGSVRKSEERVRITAQLIDAITGHHLWSERYDRDMKDIFALQDEITMKIINALRVELTEGESARLWGKGTPDLKAYLKALRAREHIGHQTKEGNILARRMAEEAIALDPEFPPSYNILAVTHMMDVWFRTTKSPKQSLRRAVELTQKALALDDSFATAHGFLGFLYTTLRQYDKGIAEGERAVALDPNGCQSHYYLGFALSYAGRFEEAVQVLEKSIRLNPFPPGFYLRGACMAYIGAGRYEEAIAVAKKAVTLASDDFLAHSVLAAAYSLAGREEEARSAAEEVLRINPKYSLNYIEKQLPFKNKGDLEQFTAALRKAGLPEHPPLPLPDKPSIAVLPFVNMSGDPEQEYFSDGITEEIITALSKTPKLFVIARNSTFTYKGKPAKVQQVGRELGVKYVLEGSVRKAEDQVRITAQLVDAQTGHHLWADRYDREMKDIFALQDEITMEIISALQMKLTEGEQARLGSEETKNLDAYLKVLQGRECFRRHNREGNSSARRLAEEAISLDPKYARAYVLLANTYFMDVQLGLSKSPRESIANAIELTKKALAINESLAWGHSLLGWLYTSTRQHDRGIAACERAIALEPSSAQAYFYLGLVFRYAGRAEESITMYKKAIRLNPIPSSPYFQGLTNSYCMTGQYDEAVTAGKKAVQLEPDNMTARAFLAVAYSLSGREEEARAEASEVLRINPKFSVQSWERTMPFRNQADLELVIGALRKAGLD